MCARQASQLPPVSGQVLNSFGGFFLIIFYVFHYIPLHDVLHMPLASFTPSNLIPFLVRCPFNFLNFKVRSNFIFEVLFLYYFFTFIILKKKVFIHYLL